MITMQQLLVDAICGIGFPSVQIAMASEQAGMASFTGNQHNHIWEWKRDRLVQCSEEQLQELYEGLFEERERLMQPTEPLEDPQLILTV